MKELPESNIYEQEFKYFIHWGKLMKQVTNIVQRKAPHASRVVDLMCGPGYLLGQLAKVRSDLILSGIDINPEFITHAQQKYPNIEFLVKDVLNFQSTEKYDVVTCTGGIHHLPYEAQESFLQKISEILKPEGLAILADPYVNDYNDEFERKQAAAKLGYKLFASLENDTPDDIIKATIDIFYNDIMGHEFKTSINKMKPIIHKLFSQVELTKTWPTKDTGYGDYYFICMSPKNITNL